MPSEASSSHGAVDLPPDVVSASSEEIQEVAGDEVSLPDAVGSSDDGAEVACCELQCLKHKIHREHQAGAPGQAGQSGGPDQQTNGEDL